MPSACVLNLVPTHIELVQCFHLKKKEEVEKGED